MELYKIEVNSYENHYYKSKNTYKQGLKRHSIFITQSLIRNLKGFKLVCKNGQPEWEKIDEC